MADSMQQKCLGCNQNLGATDAVVVQLAPCGHHCLLCKRCAKTQVQVDHDRSNGGDGAVLDPRWRCPECERPFQVRTFVTSHDTFGARNQI